MINIQFIDHHTTLNFKVTQQNTFWFCERTLNQLIYVVDSIHQHQPSQFIQSLSNSLQQSPQIIKSYIDSFCSYLNKQSITQFDPSLQLIIQDFIKNDEITLDNFLKKQNIKNKKKVSISQNLVSFQTNRAQTTKSILKNRGSTTKSQRTFTLSSSSYSSISQHIKLQVPDITFDSLKNQNQLKNFLASFDYTDLRLVGQGATTITYKATNIENQIVAVKILKKSQEGVQSALLYKSISQDMSNHLQGHTLFQHFIIECSDILLIEEDLANETLEDTIIKKTVIGEKFTHDEICKILSDLSEQLYLLHTIKKVVHNDIKPENILLDNNKYVLHDLGVAQFIADEQQPINQLIGTLLYMSPQKLEYYYKTFDQNQLEPTISIQQNGEFKMSLVNEQFYHNPYKSDIYSLGLVLLRILLHNQNISLQVQIENIFFHQRDQLLSDLIKKNQFYYHREKYIIIKNQIKVLPSITEWLLNEDEYFRPNSMELCLLLNTSDGILRSIMTPYADAFIPNFEQIQDAGYRVTYEIKKLIYEGELDSEFIERKGYGIMYRDDSKQKPLTDFKKHQTIKEVEEFDISFLDELTISVDKSININKLKSRASDQQKVIYYQGYWDRNLPNGEGVLNIYTTRNNYQQIKQIGGKLVNQQIEENLQLNVSIKANFKYGMLNGPAEFTYQNKDTQKYHYHLNMNQNILKDVLELDYGIYEFIWQSDNIFGYFIEDEQLRDQQSVFIKLNENVDIQPFLSLLNFQIKHIEYKQDYLNQLGLMEFRGERHNKNIIYTIAFQDDCKIYQKNKIERIKPQLICCFGNYKYQQIKSDIPISAPSKSLFTTYFNIIFTKVSLSYLETLQIKQAASNHLAFKKLEDLSQFAKITTLTLNNLHFLDDEQVANILMSQTVTYVRTLSLSYCPGISSNTILSICKSESLNSLQKLQLAGCHGISSTDFKYLFQTKIHKRINNLDLHDNPNLTDVKSITFPLRYLDISQCPNIPYNTIPAEVSEKLWVLIANQFPTSNDKYDSLMELSLQNSQILQKLPRIKSLNLIFAFKISYGFQYDELVFDKKIDNLRIDCQEKNLKMKINVPIYQSEGQIDEIDLFDIPSEEQYSYIQEKIIGSLNFYNQGIINHVIYDMLTKQILFYQLNLQNVDLKSYQIEMYQTVRECILSKQYYQECFRYFQRIMIDNNEYQNMNDIMESIGNGEHCNLNEYIIRYKLMLIEQQRVLDKKALNDETLKQLSQSEGLKRVEQLNFKKQIMISDTGIEHILTSQNIFLLQVINLSHTQISGLIFKLIMQNNTRLYNLKQLYLLDCNQIDFNSLQYFCQSDKIYLQYFELSSKLINTVDQFILFIQIKTLEKLKITVVHEQERYLSFSHSQYGQSDKLKCLHLDFSNIKCLRLLQILEIMNNPNLEMILLNLSNQGDITSILDEIFSWKKNNVKELALIMRNIQLNNVDRIHKFLMEQQMLEYIELRFQRNMQNIPEQQILNKLLVGLRQNQVNAMYLAFENFLSLNGQNVEQLKRLLISKQKELQKLTLNLSGCSNINKQDVRKINDALQELEELDYFSISYQRCLKIEDKEIMRMVEIASSRKKRLQKMVINIENCGNIKNGMNELTKLQDSIIVLHLKNSQVNYELFKNIKNIQIVS